MLSGAKRSRLSARAGPLSAGDGGLIHVSAVGRGYANLVGWIQGLTFYVDGLTDADAHCDCPNARSTAPNNRCAIYPQLANAIPEEQGGLSCRPKNLMVDNQFSRTVIVVPLGGTVKLNSSKLGLCMPSL